jgi:hypothetical protein
MTLSGYACTDCRVAEDNTELPMVESRMGFQHNALDQSKGAFRLLKVRSDLSTDGLIQCEIWHDVTVATYSCLSYVWGPDGDYQDILVNGKLFQCRRNLWDFLNAAKTSYAATPEVFWIDAICIDQTNILERNQQVAQMGEIYSSASSVLIWLGCNENVAHFLDALAQLAAENPTTKKGASRFWYRGKSKQRQTGWLAFFDNVYWTRAWITQEIFLAKSIQILAQNTVIGGAEIRAFALLFPLLISISSTSIDTTDSEHRKDMALAMELYLRIMVGSKHTSLNHVDEFEKNMLDLSHFLRRRESQIPRDRIYSLRDIAQDGGKIRVDYGASDIECLLQVFDSFSDSICLCSLTHITSILGFSSSNIINPSNRLALVTVPVAKSSILRLDDVSQDGVSLIIRHDQLLPTGLDKTFRCGGCGLDIVVDIAVEQTLCLHQLCRERSGQHLVVRMDAASDPTLPMLRVASKDSARMGGRIASLNRIESGIDLTDYEAKERKPEAWDSKNRRKERPSKNEDPEMVNISMHLDSWIQIALCTASSDGAMCFKARKGGCGDSAFSRAVRQMKVT